MPMEATASQLSMLVSSRRKLLGLALSPLLVAGCAGSGDDAALEAAKELYAAKCASCHGDSRAGGFAPPLAGKGFVNKWQGQGTDALAEYIRTNMPPAEAGTLDIAAADSLARLLLDEKTARSGKTAQGEGGEAPGDGGVLASKPNYDAVYSETLKARAEVLAKLRPVTDAMLQDPPEGDWLSIRRTFDAQGFSPLKQIDSGNVQRLSVAWSLALTSGSNEIAPLAHDGVLFLNSGGTVVAVNGVDGDVLWIYSRQAKVQTVGPPVSQPRGMAIFDNKLIVPTVDRHVIALDMRSGKVMWDSVVAKDEGLLRLTAAPIVVRGKVIQGLTGCVDTSDCAIVALDARTGAEVWRFATIAKSGMPGGNSWAGMANRDRQGGSVWSTPSYDPATNLIYAGTGQTYKITDLMRRSPRRGESNDALYTDTTLALDPDSGRLVWHYQHMARDVWDLDWAFERTVLSLPNKQRAVATMGKIGILDVLDAKTGKYLFSQDLGLQNVIKSIDPRTGRKNYDPAKMPVAGKAVNICPYATGVRNWPATAFDPRTGRMFIPILRSCAEQQWVPGSNWEIFFGAKYPERERGDYGAMVALNVAKRRLEWHEGYRAPYASAVLATAGGLIFHGGIDREFRASDSRTGALLWSLKLDQMASSTPIAFEADGIQYIAVTTGGGGPLSVLVGQFAPEIAPVGQGVRLWVFKVQR